MTPLWLQILQAVAVLCISGVGAWLAWQQVQIARVKLQHDLYDRRYRVFEETLKYLLDVTAHEGNPPQEAVQAFMRATADAVFLFDLDLVAYLDDMRNRACKLSLTNVLVPTLPLASTERAAAVTTASEHTLWLAQQLEGITAKFIPSLKLDKRQRPYS
jgi:hypothetical protein